MRLTTYTRDAIYEWPLCWHDDYAPDDVRAKIADYVPLGIVDALWMLHAGWHHTDVLWVLCQRDVLPDLVLGEWLRRCYEHARPARTLDEYARACVPETEYLDRYPLPWRYRMYLQRTVYHRTLRLSASHDVREHGAALRAARRAEDREEQHQVDAARTLVAAWARASCLTEWRSSIATSTTEVNHAAT